MASINGDAANFVGVAASADVSDISDASDVASASETIDGPQWSSI